jgi:chemotaxis protein methyltransferase CheR
MELRDRSWAQLGARYVGRVRDDDLAVWLRWALPRMGLRERGFRNFRGTLKKRIGRRLVELGLADLTAYRARLEADPSEWAALDAICRITISRLYRDRAVMDTLGDVILAEAAARGGSVVRVWSAGCASGEEPYTVALVWQTRVAPMHPEVALAITATDADAALVERARRGEYESGSLRELPEALRDVGLVPQPLARTYVVSDLVRRTVAFEVQDLRREMPAGTFDVILCRNLAFTYFDLPTQERVGRELVRKLVVPGGVLVVGQHEEIPAPLELVPRARCIYGPSS